MHKTLWLKLYFLFTMNAYMYIHLYALDLLIIAGHWPPLNTASFHFMFYQFLSGSPTVCMLPSFLFPFLFPFTGPVTADGCHSWPWIFPLKHLRMAVMIWSCVNSSVHSNTAYRRSCHGLLEHKEFEEHELHLCFPDCDMLKCVLLERSLHSSGSHPHSKKCYCGKIWICMWRTQTI